jgi:hypothetical protein
VDVTVIVAGGVNAADVELEFAQRSHARDSARWRRHLKLRVDLKLCVNLKLCVDSKLCINLVKNWGESLGLGWSLRNRQKNQAWD